MVSAGSGFLSQHSKELLFGLGASQRVVRLTVEWPSGRTQDLTDVALNRRLGSRTGEVSLGRSPLAAMPALPADVAAPEPASPPSATWLFEPFPAPDFSLHDLRGEDRSLAALRGRPAVVLLAWATEAAPSRAALLALAAGGTPSPGQVSARSPSPSTPARTSPRVRAAASGVTSVPVLVASQEVALGWAILNRHLFIGRQDLQLPTVFLLDARGGGAPVYRDRVDIAPILRDAPTIDAPPDERLARARPFEGTFDVDARPARQRPYGRDLLDQGLESQAVVAFELAAQGIPSASVLYRLGSLLAKKGESAKARPAYERALALQPDLAEASNDLGTLLAEAGDLPGAIARFRAALAATPDYPDALNNLGYALLLTGQAAEARELYERALALQPDFPEALNNLGLILGRRARWTARSPSSGRRSRAPGLRRGGQQPRPGPGARGRPRTRSACSGVPRGEPRVREHLRHAGEHLPGRGSTRRGAGHRRSPLPAKPHPPPAPRAFARQFR